jgi:hypothetical protein
MANQRSILGSWRLAGEGDPAVGLEPERIDVRDHFPGGAAVRLDQARIPDEGGVELEEPVIHRPVRRVEDHLEQAHTIAARLE